MANRLNHEKSRYLRMHAQNPVNWYPWGEEAFRKAEEEKKPLLISIGYSSCHWCHVMAHESFENPGIAEILNTRYIPVKVDKEEYPDVDGYYMDFASRLMGNGGWPLNVFVSPGKAPFFAFTYLPRDRFERVLNQTADNYSARQSLHENAAEESLFLNSLEEDDVRSILASFEPDDLSGRSGPRFPLALYYSFLTGMKTDDASGRYIGEFLENSINRGLFDHIQGGWFRYTVDPDWKIPHFEKMLYDQAAMLYLCTRAYTFDTRLADYAVRRTTRWLREHMILPGGLYGSATDADTDQGEGYYYTIGETENPDVRALFRLDEAGMHDGRYIPWIDRKYIETHPVESEQLRLDQERLRQGLTPPALDEKAVFGWNAFLGYVFLLCYKRLGDQYYLDLADELFGSLSPFADGIRIPHVIYGDSASPTGYEYLSDYSAWLLFSTELVKYRPDSAGVPGRVLERIMGKFLAGNRIYHTTVREFESLSLWQDVPFPSGGSMLVNALLNFESGEIVRVIKSTMGIMEYAAHNPEFFPFWLQGFSRFFRD